MHFIAIPIPQRLYLQPWKWLPVQVSMNCYVKAFIPNIPGIKQRKRPSRSTETLLAESTEMKIGIIGTRGIPNYYGGFEEFAEFVAPALVKKGHSVVVYNSSLHPYRQSEWNGVKLITKYDPEDRVGTFGQFIYDLNCILDAHRRGFDVILQLGYTS